MFVGSFSPLQDRNERVGEENLNERTSDRDHDDKQGSEAKDKDSAASSADRAKEREREMDESGEENAA